MPPPPPKPSLEKLLGRRSKAELVALLEELAADDTVLGDWLLRRLEQTRDDDGPASTAGTGPAESPARITRADYSPIQRGLDSLLRCEAHERLLQLAPAVLRFASADAARQPGDADVAGETTACIEIVFTALRRVRWRLIDKLIWYWDFLLLDHHSLLESLPSPIDDALLPARDWREAAEYFQIRLGEVIQSGGQGSYAGTAARRGELVEMITDALVQMDEIDAATDVLMMELPHTLCYPQLVFHLADHGFEAEAESWARQGFAVTAASRPDIAWSLAKFLVTLARQRGDALLVAAFRADEFLARPSLKRYRRLRAAIDDPQRWELVQLQLLAWLEFDERPSQSPDWPLPDTGLALDLDDHPIRRNEANLELLIDILLDEGEVEYAAKIFDRMRWQRPLAERIADAALETNPDIARKLLKRIVESWIDEVRVKSYRQAGKQLRQLQALCLRHHWQAEFAEFLATLRKKHAAKQRLLEILDEVETSPPVTLRLVKHSRG